MGLNWPFPWPLASDLKGKVDFLLFSIAKTITECLLVLEIKVGTEYHGSIFAPESQEYDQPYVDPTDLFVNESKGGPRGSPFFALRTLWLKSS